MELTRWYSERFDKTKEARIKSIRPTERKTPGEGSEFVVGIELQREDGKLMKIHVPTSEARVIIDAMLETVVQAEDAFQEERQKRLDVLEWLDQYGLTIDEMYDAPVQRRDGRIILMYTDGDDPFEIDMPKLMDLSILDTERAAKITYTYCRGLAAHLGQDPDIEVQLLDPDESQQRSYGDGWTVVWEAGPWQWAVYLSSGESLFYGEKHSEKPDMELDVISSNRYWCEPYNGWSLVFMDA